MTSAATTAPTKPRVRWTRKRPFSGAAARQHKLWNPVFTKLTGKPGTWAHVAECLTRPAANRQMTALRKYLRKTRKGSASYFQLEREGLAVYCRYMPPSVTDRYEQ